MVVVLDVLVMWVAVSPVVAVLVGVFLYRAGRVAAAREQDPAASPMPMPRPPLDVLQLRLAERES